jgi:hypothetical protein
MYFPIRAIPGLEREKGGGCKELGYPSMKSIRDGTSYEM